MDGRSTNLEFMEMRCTMTPAEYNKQTTILLSKLLADTGFSKKRIWELRRKAKECEQHFSFSFTRNRGLPGNLYSVNPTLSFAFKEVDQLTSRFLGKEYDAKWGTGAQSLYTLMPGEPLSSFQYCSDEPLDHYAQRVAEDFRIYALPFFETYDTVEKLEVSFEQSLIRGIDRGGFRVVRSSGSDGGRACCYAAVLCLLKKWDKLRVFVGATDRLLPEQKERIIVYVEGYGK